jgi:hypothetical protein
VTNPVNQNDAFTEGEREVAHELPVWAVRSWFAITRTQPLPWPLLSNVRVAPLSLHIPTFQLPARTFTAPAAA